MASAIDATKPSDGSPGLKSDLRDNLAAAKSEIEAIQSSIPLDMGDFSSLASGSDHTLQVQAACEAAVAQNRKLLVPAGDYNIQPQVSGTSAITLDLTSGQSLIMECPVFRGAKFTFKTFGGGNPADQYEVIDGELWRGRAFHFIGENGAKSNAVILKNLVFDGNIPNANQNDGSFPADPNDGSGWDITNNALRFEKGFDYVELENIHAYDFRGEIFYSGAAYPDMYLHTKNCKVHSTNANAINLGSAGWSVHENFDIYDCGNDAFEHAIVKGAIFENGRVEDCKSGISIGQYSDSDLLGQFKVKVTGNTIRNCPQGGVRFYGYCGSIHDNLIVDCGTANSQGQIMVHTGVDGIWAEEHGGITVKDNQLFAINATPLYGIGVLEGGTVSNINTVLVEGNQISSIFGASTTHDGAFRTTITRDFADVYFVRNTVGEVKRLVTTIQPTAPTNFGMPCFADNLASNVIGYDTGETFSIDTGDLDVAFFSQRVQITALTADVEPNVLGGYLEGHQCEIVVAGSNAIVIPADSGQWRFPEARTVSPGDAILIEYRKGKWREVMYLAA